MDCEYEDLGLYYGCDECLECAYYRQCKEYDDFSQQEDYLMELARERDDYEP